MYYTVFVIFMLVSDRAVTVHKTAASVDPLSGMLNRRGFSEACNRVIERDHFIEVRMVELRITEENDFNLPVGTRIEVGVARAAIQ
jgi:GGDEF domain-containing protein